MAWPFDPSREEAEVLQPLILRLHNMDGTRSSVGFDFGDDPESPLCL